MIKYTPDSFPQVGHPYRRLLQRFEELVNLYTWQPRSNSDKRKLHQISFEYYSGFDELTGVSFQIYSARNNSWDNRYKVDRVVERTVSSGKE